MCWGCGEMVKKISCKVISSKPLINRGDILPYINKPNNNRQKVDNNAASDPQISHTRNLFTYSHSLNMEKKCIDAGLIGQLLDCYA